MSIAKWLETNSQDPDLPASAVRYWFRTAMGIESMVADEIKARLEVYRLFHSHRNVFVAVNRPADSDGQEMVVHIRTADDVYRYIGCCHGIDNTKNSVGELVEYFSRTVIPLLLEYRQTEFVRLTVSFVGKRNFSRYFVENKLNELILENTGFKPLSNEEKVSKQAGELRLRCHLENDIAFWGIGLQDTPLHRRTWRSIKYTGQLHTPVAAAMVRALQPAAGAVIIDPFCGSGTILIESAIQYPDHQHLGFDINEEAVDTARQSAALAAVKASFQRLDSIQRLPAQKNYYLISNPPWDEKHPISGQNNNAFLEGLIRLIAGSWGAVLLLPEEMVMDIQRRSELPIQQLAQTRVRGKLALIIKTLSG